MDPAVIIAVVGALGGLGGAGAFVTVFLQRKKFKAEAADVLTDTALTLVEPLQARVRELETEARATRTEVRNATTEARTLKNELHDVIAVLRRWRSAVLTSSITREELERMVREDTLPTVNGADMGGRRYDR